MKGQFNSNNHRLFVPKTFSEYLYYLERLELDFYSLKWDFEYLLTQEGWTPETSIASDNFLQAKKNLQDFKDSFFAKRFEIEHKKLKALI